MFNADDLRAAQDDPRRDKTINDALKDNPQILAIGLSQVVPRLGDLVLLNPTLMKDVFTVMLCGLHLGAMARDKAIERESKAVLQ